LIELMEKLGCDKLATGHYARIVNEEHVYHLLEAVDQEKDQSYYLYGLSQEQLSKILFPLGSLQKQEVFALAKKYNVPYDEVSYRESQDLCFFPEKEPEEFLKRHITDATPGDIRLEDETVVGTHKGIPFYTIGQRKGLGIGGLTIPLYVTRKRADTNTIYVAEDGADFKIDLIAKDLRWISWIPEKNSEIELEVRIHSHGNRHSGMLRHDGKYMFFRFNKGLRGIAPGQSIVLYHGQEIVGGGTITEFLL
ncbi:MAG: tRNA 2-thiouridine(34) synthase MnmA, partial [Candidatus Peregrinibacteria bacterium]|nr:tRNA 2-thiouridine(34) synthase MnmA [Candidatus Peregrinibacteria bacterium]